MAKYEGHMPIGCQIVCCTSMGRPRVYRVGCPTVARTDITFSSSNADNSRGLRRKVRGEAFDFAEIH